MSCVSIIKTLISSNNMFKILHVVKLLYWIVIILKIKNYAVKNSYVL